MVLWLLASALTFGLLIAAEYHTEITLFSGSKKWLGLLLISALLPFPSSLIIVGADAINDMRDG